MLLGCDALNNNAVEEICKIKGIKSEKTNLSIICESISQAAEYSRINNVVFALMKNNLPGPFTFILPALSQLPKAFKKRKAVGIRIPDNNIAMELVKKLGHPIMTTSIKYDDDDYGCEPELNSRKLYKHGGCYNRCRKTGNLTPSTIVDCTDRIEYEITREGKGILQ